MALKNNKLPDIKDIEFNYKTLWKKIKPSSKTYPIVALDTETVEGKPFLCYTSTGRFIEFFTFLDFCDFSFSLGLDDSINFFYNLTYDMEALFKLLSKDDLLFLHHSYEFKTGNYYVSYIPKKVFKIKCGNKTVKFFDFAQFKGYKPLKELAYETPYAKIEVEDIDNISLQKYKNDIEYKEHIKKRCYYDTLILYELTNSFYQDMLKIVNVKNFYSSATIGKQTVLTHLIEDLKLPSKVILDFAIKAYNGGRFETLKKGYFENANIYDINSAYPSYLIMLKSCDGVIKFSNEYEPDSIHSYFKIKIYVEDKYISPIMRLHHKLGLYVFPKGEFTVFCGKDLVELLLKYQYDFKILTGIHIFNKNYTLPFKYLEDLYYERKIIKDKLEKLETLKINEKEKNSELDNEILSLKNKSQVIKLILNSIYGSFINVNYKYELLPIKDIKESDFEVMDVEGVIHCFKKSKKAVAGSIFNPIFASEITEKTRNKLFDVSKRYEKDIIFFATDGILTKYKMRNLKVDTNLGNWEHKKHNALVIGGGIYQLDNLKIKTRGFKSFPLMETLKHHKYSNEIYTYSKRPQHFKECLIQNRLDDMNLFQEKEKVFSINIDKKRNWFDTFRFADDVLNKHIDSETLRM